MEKWSWGQMSPQEAQELAFKATVDFQEANTVPPLGLQYLASLGTSGAHKLLARRIGHESVFLKVFSPCFVALQQVRNNMHRQLLAFANKFVLLPAPFQPKITFKEPYSAQMQMMILPHELFSSLYHSYKEAWKSIMVPCAAQRPEIWTFQ